MNTRSRTNRRFSLLALFLCVSWIAAGSADSADKVEGGRSKVVRRGADIGTSDVVSLANVMERVDPFLEKMVIVEGVVDGVCRKMGCWMTLVFDADKPGIRVTFKDYGFFVPKDAGGMVARMEGTFHVQTWSKEDADHLEGEGAHLARNPDGTANEIGFVATGVELRKKN